MIFECAALGFLQLRPADLFTPRIDTILLLTQFNTIWVF